MLPVSARKGEHRMLVTMMTSLSQESITRSLQLPCIFFPAFSQTSLFLV